MNAIESVLRERIGLDAASVGSSSIERTVRLRMKTLGLKDAHAYLHLLETSRNEWEELVESVVVSETWFFRDSNSFAAFVQMVQHEWLPRHPIETLRLLSVPCSSGEEPYSLAMALLDADISPELFIIDGVDLSARAVARAERAVYGKNSFRGQELDFRDRHFQAAKNGYILRPEVRKCVQFQRANVFDEEFLNGRAAYDFIFCRNLLIYFDSESRKKTLEKLERLLGPQGVLFVGPAELPLATSHGFVSANVPMAFACRKPGASTTASPARRELGSRPRKAAETSVTSMSAPPQNQIPLAVPTQKAEASPHASTPNKTMERGLPDLAAARQLADAGRLAEAATMCQAHLDHLGPSAQAYYLLGLLRDADGDPQAMDYYRKALYLEPNHYETLLQMSLLLEKEGDSTSARTFKRRAERVRQKS